MDIDLFQGVLLGLLAVGLIVLIALLATLGGIRKALEDGVQRAPDRDSFGPEPSAGSEHTARAQAPASQTEPDGDTAAASYATPVAQAAPEAEASGRADTIRSVLQQHGAGAEEQAAAASESQEPAVDSAFAAHADDPQEEPFQRDGRWWFRRGDELLVYDEASGQWQPAGEGEGPTPSAGAPATEAATTGQVSTGGASESQTQNMPEVADQVTTFWKCPTCGAVNGSTATSCRMCFAARP